MKVILLAIPFSIISCIEKKSTPVPISVSNPLVTEVKVKSAVDKYYEENNQDSIVSISTGSPRKGKLKNGSLIPPSGPNFKYFADESYLKGRAYVNSNVKSVLLSAFTALESSCPSQIFQVMECAHEEGGELWPHRTHQNGTSVDLMLPKLKGEQVDYSIDGIGLNHYFLNTDREGNYIDHEGVKINFEHTAQLILAINNAARQKGWEISKVIFRIELKKHLMATASGKKIAQENIYFAQQLSKKVNEFHDDHIHIDFAPIQ